MLPIPMKEFFQSNGKKLFMTSLSIVVLGTLFTMIVYETTKKSVTVVENGKTMHYETHAGTVEDLLKTKGFHLKSHDEIQPSTTTKIKDNMKIVWQTARHVTVNFDGNKKQYWSTADTVQNLLAQENIQVSQYDKITPALSTPIKSNMDINYHSSFQVKLNVGGKTSDVWTTSTTVADFLKQHNIKLGKSDLVQPSLNQPLTKPTSVKVIRVKKVTDVVEAPIDYRTITKNDSQLPKGTKRVLSPGKKGKVSKTYEVTYHNGKQVSRKLTKTKTVAQSSDRVIELGTRTYHVSRSENGSSKTIRVYSTAYTAHCRGCSGYTSYERIDLKTHPDAKVIAVDPSVIPLGTKVYVPGYGYAIAADTGGAINGDRIDVFFPTDHEAYHWGAKWITIKLLN